MLILVRYLPAKCRFSSENMPFIYVSHPHYFHLSSIGFMFAIMCGMFFALVIGFAGFITLAGQMDNQCVRVGGKVFDAEGAAFADAFALSWTTFSTVGYGSSNPALGFQNDSPTNCFFINFICSLESLTGVLYSGFCGGRFSEHADTIYYFDCLFRIFPHLISHDILAILFGKVLRIQSRAQVIFSDPIVIRYGPGVERVYDENEDDAKDNKAPCPVLEFRLANRLFNEVGGEIMDGTYTF